MKNAFSKLQKGFTVLELMITVAIMGILAAVALPAYQDYKKKQAQKNEIKVPKKAPPATTTPTETIGGTKVLNVYDTEVFTATKVVVTSDQDFATTIDFKTDQLCHSRTGSTSSLMCRDFEIATAGQRKIIEEARAVLADPTAKMSGGSTPVRKDTINYEVNLATSTVTEYDGWFARNADFKQEMLCLTKSASRDSDVSCKDFSDLSDKQRTFVGQLHNKLTAARELAAPKS